MKLPNSRKPYPREPRSTLPIREFRYRRLNTPFLNLDDGIPYVRFSAVRIAILMSQLLGTIGTRNRSFVESVLHQSQLINASAWSISMQPSPRYASTLLRTNNANPNHGHLISGHRRFRPVKSHQFPTNQEDPVTTSPFVRSFCRSKNPANL